MILITGGAYQGKTSLAFEMAGIEAVGKLADGCASPYEAAYVCPVILHYHEYIKRLLADGQDPAAFTAKVMAENPDAVITVNELGCGIVPIDPDDRRYREASGRMSVLLARKAKEVYRVVCGIPARIK